jgi:dolichol-phosphate mannosyltransferase
LAGARLDHAVANFGIYGRGVIQAYLEMRDSHRVFPLFVQWTGFPTATVPVEHAPRAHGRSGYNFHKRFTLAVKTIIAFSNKPLHYMTMLGFLISGASVALIVYYLACYFLGYIVEPGFTSLILSIWFVGGLLMTCMGVLGIYVGRVFDQTKGRPWFIIDESTPPAVQQDDLASTSHRRIAELQDVHSPE